MTNAMNSPRRGYRHPSSERGWSDYRAGRPFPKDYDTWFEKEQRNYENGRLRAANATLALGSIPIRQPSATNRLFFRMVSTKVGTAIPGRISV